jgi:hypothetical protein
VVIGTDLRTEDRCVQLHPRRCSYLICVQCLWTRCIASGYAASIRFKPHLLRSYGSLAFVYADWMSQLSSFHRRLILYTALRRVQLNPDRYEAVRQTVLWQGHLDDFFIAYRHFNWIPSALIKSLTELWNTSWTCVLRHSEFQDLADSDYRVVRKLFSNYEM